MMMLAACDDDGAGNGGILRFCLLATDMAGRARQQHEGVCGACGRGLATAKISTSVCTFLWECRGLLFRLNMKNNETLFCAALSQCPWQKLSTVLLACSFPHSTSFLRFFRFTFAHNLTAGATMKRFRSHYVYDTLWLPQSHDRQAGKQQRAAARKMFQSLCVPPKTACHKVIYEKVLPPFWSFFFVC